MNPKPHDFTKPAPLSAAGRDRLANWTRVALGLANKTWAKQMPVKLEAALGEWDGLYAEQALSAMPDPGLAYRVLVGRRRASDAPGHAAQPDAESGRCLAWG